MWWSHLVCSDYHLILEQSRRTGWNTHERNNQSDFLNNAKWITIWQTGGGLQQSKTRGLLIKDHITPDNDMLFD